MGTKKQNRLWRYRTKKEFILGLDEGIRTERDDASQAQHEERVSTLVLFSHVLFRGCSWRTCDLLLRVGV